jgi:hypothetical protein
MQSLMIQSPKFVLLHKASEPLSLDTFTFRAAWLSRSKSRNAWHIRQAQNNLGSNAECTTFTSHTKDLEK